MTRVRVALVLAVGAALAVLATAALAVTTYGGGDDDPPAPLVVTDPGTGARFEVPGEEWTVRGARSRIYYEDEAGEPTAVVTGAAVYRDGYCAEQPGDSNRGFAGFTDQTFDAWRSSLDPGAAEEHRDRVKLTDGSSATLRWVRLPGGSGPCAAPDVEVAMVSSGGFRVVLVADAGADGTLAHDDVVRILTSVRP